MRLLLIFVTLALITGPVLGCQAQPKPEQIAAADFGQPPDRNSAILQADLILKEALKDPSSRRVDWGEIRKAWVGRIYVGEPAYRYGYLFFADVNAKNSFGGYVGKQPYMFFFQNGRLVDAFDRHRWPRFGLVR